MRAHGSVCLWLRCLAACGSGRFRPKMTVVLAKVRVMGLIVQCARA